MVSIYSLDVKCTDCDEVEQPDPPENRVMWIIGAAVLFAGIGFVFGSVAGVATAGFGFVAWFFTVPLGLYFGYKIGSFGAELMDGPSCPACGSTHNAGLLPF